MILQVGTLDETFTVGENISDSCCCKEISKMLFCSMPFLMGKLIRKNGQNCKVISLRRCGSIFRLLPRFIKGGSITFEKRVKSCYYIVPHTHSLLFFGRDSFVGFCSIDSLDNQVAPLKLTSSKCWPMDFTPWHK